MSIGEYDLLVIGAGSGGVALSRRAAAHGARVAIVEAGRVGGTCVLRGCVPKKLLMYAAEFGDAFALARGYGWAVAPPQFEMLRWAEAKAAETARLEGIYRRLLEGSGVVLVEGRARLFGPGQVQVDTAEGALTLAAPHIALATGASPITARIPGLELCATSDDLLDLTELPREAAIVGAGYIGVEFASMLARLGVRVALYFRGRLPLTGFDEMLRGAALAELQAAGVELHAGQVPSRVQAVAGGRLLCFGDERVREFPWVLNATGRRPNSAGLGLESVGIVPDAAGAVPVDAGLATSARGVFALGDLTNRRNLTPVAIAEGRALADTLFGGQPRQVSLDRVASAVFMLPPLASIGPTEAERVAAGLPTQVFETEFRPMKTAFTGGAQRTRMKLLVDATSQRVEAVHMAGPDAPEIVQSLAVALSAGATKADFDRTLAVHPTAAEEFVLMREPTRVV